MDYFYITLLFLAGIIFGSFLNVVIYRLPKGLSLIKPSSQCTHCGMSLKWHENIPLISYLFLKGKCSNCSKKISFVYPLVEIIAGLLFIVTALYTKNTIQFVFYIVLAMLFVALIFIDFKHYLLPDNLLIPAFLISLIYFGYTEKTEVMLRIMFGLMTGAALFLLRYITSKLYAKETFGMGDVKLGALIGFLIGSLNAYIAIFFGFIIAAVIFSFLIVLKKVNRNSYMPFGPYMVFGMLVFLLCGENIIHWYLHFFY